MFIFIILIILASGLGIGLLFIILKSSIILFTRKPILAALLNILIVGILVSPFDVTFKFLMVTMISSILMYIATSIQKKENPFIGSIDPSKFSKDHNSSKDSQKKKEPENNNEEMQFNVSITISGVDVKFKKEDEEDGKE